MQHLREDHRIELDTEVGEHIRVEDQVHESKPQSIIYYNL